MAIPSINPSDAASRGLRPIKSERKGGTKNVKEMDASAERYAAALGLRIVGRWDENAEARNPKSGGYITIWRRTYWCMT